LTNRTHRYYLQGRDPDYPGAQIYNGPGRFTVVDTDGSVLYEERDVVGTWWVTEDDGGIVRIVRNDMPAHPSVEPVGVQVYPGVNQEVTPE
jgi:hypothetical protein